MNKWLVCAGLLLSAQIAQGQDYLWPTDASRYLTSGFGEARPRRFHAAIDIKTWNQTGYKIFATRSGYVERMGISPFGYGRVLYLRLDTGEVVVYGHLERFNDKLQAMAEAEQQRQGEFRIEKYFEAGALPVQQGELLGYTGQSGIGVPHLHFEMRDSRNRPINPLHKNFKIVDTIRPIVKTVVVSPLSVGATIDGDYMAKAFKPVGSNGKLRIPEPIRVEGKVGFALEAYDQADGAPNQFNVYRSRLYVDGNLQFQSQFDRFSYSENKLIELMQDFFLQRRGWGRLDKLYRESGNTLEFYSHLNAAAGALAVALTAPASTSPPDSMRQHDAGNGLAWGGHDFQIIVEDFFGNQSSVEGQLLAGPSFPLQVASFPSEEGKLALQIQAAARDHALATVEASGTATNNWNNEPPWHAMRAKRFASPLAAEAAEADTGRSHVFPDMQASNFEDNSAWNLLVTKNSSKVIRVQGWDEHGVASLPFFVLPDSTAIRQPEAVIVNKDFYPQFLRLEVTSSFPFLAAPRVQLTAHENQVLVPLRALEPNRYVGVVALADIAADSVWLEALTTNGDSSAASWREAFGNVAVLPEKGGRLQSPEGSLQLRFASGAVYWPIYGRVLTLVQKISDTRVTGPIYHCEPQDAPLRSAAVVEISYPDSVSNPQRWGIGYREHERWMFMKADADLEKRTLATEVYSLEDFALMRDQEPPVLTPQSPAPGETLTQRRPLLSFHVDDATSGFESERAIKLRLDGLKLIAEYDPEREIIFYRPPNDLKPGNHVLAAEAEDRCGNMTRREVKFSVQ